MKYAIDHTKVVGWGIDADPKNNPTYPYQDKGTHDPAENTHVRPAQQAVTMETLKSNERKNMPAVVGQTVPPWGCSGALRRYAFQYSENKYRHWLPLLLADRINAIEGIVDDLRRGSCPNLFKERGWASLWKYDKKGALKRIAIGTLAAMLVIQWNRKK